MNKSDYLSVSFLRTPFFQTQRIVVQCYTAINRLSIILNSDQSDKIKRHFFQAAVVSRLFYGCTWTLIKRIEKNRDRNCARILRAILNKSKKQHTPKQLLNGHLPPISKTIKVRRTSGARTFFFESLHLDVPMLADQQELIFISSERTLYELWKTGRSDGW